MHVGIIMDGNGRWATAQGRPRSVGHRIGARVVRQIVETAPDLGIRTLTLYAFSADNWSRPSAEVGALMRLFHLYLRDMPGEARLEGLRLSVIGNRQALPGLLREAIAQAEAATAGGGKLHLRLAVNYSARNAILAASASLPASREEFARAMARALGEADPAPDVDLLIRTGGEQRLSDFLLWECAYAELVFVRTLWPDFTAADLEAALSEFHQRQRRFGRVA